MNLLQEINEYYHGSLAGKDLAFWGLPSRLNGEGKTPDRSLIEQLLAAGTELRVHDPKRLLAQALPECDKRVVFCATRYATIEETDGLIIGAAAPEYSRPDFDLMRRMMRRPVLFDAANLYNPADTKAAGLICISDRSGSPPGRVGALQPSSDAPGRDEIPAIASTPPPEGERPHGRPDESDRLAHPPRPDAPLKWSWRLLLAGLNFLVLSGVLMLPIVIVIPWFWPKPEGRAQLVTDDVIIRSRIAGVFLADRPLSPGAWVPKNLRLGVVDSRVLLAEIEVQERRLEGLRQQKIQLEAWGTPAGDPTLHWQQEQGFRGLDSQIAEVDGELRRLRNQEGSRIVFSPVAGRLPDGLDGSKKVEANDPVTRIWPDGGELWLEVDAPQTLLNHLQATGRVRATFSTQDGEFQVEGEPVEGSVRPFVVRRAGDFDDYPGDVRGLLRCALIDPIPDPVRQPGLFGTAEIVSWRSHQP